MTIRAIARRFLAFTLTFIFIYGSAPSSFAQNRRTRAQTARKSPARKLPSATKRSRPPRTFDVLHYTINTRFDVPQKTVIGDTLISLKPLANDFNSFALDASSMKIEAVTLVDNDTALKWTQPPNKLAIALDRAYEPSETINVRIRYRSTPERGLYFVAQNQASSPGAVSKPAQVWTQGEPEENHHWFPCYDFPDDKATSEQYITTGATEIAISNGKLIEMTTNGDGTRTFHWKMEQPHASYLTSLVVGNYAKLEDAYKNIPLEYYTYYGTEETARQAFGKTPEMMQLFSQKLDYEYPYERYAQTIVANFIFGGMENITATTHADSEILYSTSKESQISTENLISHELAHSWFGNLVTCKDWSELWLNEGFATFMEAVFREHDAGHDAYLSEMRSNTSLFMLEDLLKYRRPLVYDLSGTALDIFDATVYKKGGLVLHMLRETVGDELFWKALHRYLNEYKYQPVTTRDLQRVFEEVTNRKLDWFFDQWVYKAGFPELQVRSFYQAPTNKLTLEVTQTQSASAMTPLIFRLPVEIEIATASGARTERIEITQRSQRFTFQLDGKPLMIRFDKGAKVLKQIVFPQPASMLKYQLTHSSDVIGRVEAAEALAKSTGLAIPGLEITASGSPRRESGEMDRRRGLMDRARQDARGIFP